MFSLIMPGSRVRVPPLLLVSQSLDCGWLVSLRQSPSHSRVLFNIHVERLATLCTSLEVHRVPLEVFLASDHPLPLMEFEEQRNFHVDAFGESYDAVR